MEILGNVSGEKEHKKDMKIYFCLYSNAKFEIPRKALSNLARKSKIFEDVFEYNREWLETTDFFNDNKEMLSPKNIKGDGWCLWKPYVILESLKKIKYGDVVLYMDSSDTFFNNFGEFLREYFKDNDILLVKGGGPNKKYTQRDTFFYMGCDSSLYWETHQVEAGVIGIKKSQESVSFIEEYLSYCSDPRIMRDDENSCGLPNFPEFDNNRYDQSVLSNLKTKYGISTNEGIRNYIECNMWEPLLEKNLYEFNKKLYNVFRFSSHDTPMYDMWQEEYLKIVLDGKY